MAQTVELAGWRFALPFAPPPALPFLPFLAALRS